MGQATLDLPDPTLSGVDAGPISPEALASADDLLSQLAGDDIDRLLAEADTERAAAPDIAPPAPAVAPPPESPTIAARDPAPLAHVEAKAPTPSDDVATAEAVTSAAIDAILAPAIESTVQAVEAQAAAQPTAEPIAEPSLAPIETANDQPTFEPVDQKLLDEAAARVASIMDPPAATPEAAVAPSAVADSAERAALSEPLILPEQKVGSSNWLWPLVKLLELINAPMNFFSDEVREGMGKVALVTTFNAAAVLVYVMLFRRK
jgi:hypothetical protein